MPQGRIQGGAQIQILPPVDGWMDEKDAHINNPFALIFSLKITEQICHWGDVSAAFHQFVFMDGWTDNFIAGWIDRSVGRWMHGGQTDLWLPV